MSDGSNFPQLDPTVTLASIADFSKRLGVVKNNLRKEVLAPRPIKVAPSFTSSQVAELCGIDRNRLNYLVTREGSTLPQGELKNSGRIRLFTLKEARTWVQAVSEIKKSPLLTKGVGQGRVLVTSNFKGGSCKTSSAMCIAQGLTLRGRKVLLVDLDPQASLTELCGIFAEKDVDDEDTILPFIYDEPAGSTLESAIQPTYWDGLDVIAANPSLFGAEFHIPAMVIRKKNYPFWRILRDGLEPLRSKYDYIILDTAPSLSYLTLNGLLAADAMVMPLVPENLDFVSSMSFWTLFSDLSKDFIKLEAEKKYDFVTILLSKVEYGPTSSASLIRTWAHHAYGPWQHSIEIPSSSAMSSAALVFSTVFDLDKGDANSKTLQRVKGPFVEFCRWIDDQYVPKWEE